MSTKMRRPVIMSTPPPQSRSKSLYSEEEKRGLLENFDLEVADKTQAFQACLDAQLKSFKLRQETEILKLPKGLRDMKISELMGVWGGDFQSTLQNIARERLELREREEREEREREERERLEAENVKGKRKRGTSDSSPSQGSKNPRTAPPGSTKKTLSSALQRKQPKRAQQITSSSTKPHSTLPQDHVFAPTIPATPLLPRQARIGEAFISLNGSPIAFNPEALKVLSPIVQKTTAPVVSRSPLRTMTLNPTASSSSSQQQHGNKVTNPAIHTTRDLSEEGSDSEEGEKDEEVSSEGDDDDDDDLPDPAALEAKLLAQSQSQNKPPSKPSRKKRAPSLIFQQPQPQFHSSSKHLATPNKSKALPSLPPGMDNVDQPLSTIQLKDGRVISFNPLAVTPTRLEGELDEGGVSAKERAAVLQRIQEEAHDALMRRMDKWALK